MIPNMRGMIVTVRISPVCRSTTGSALNPECMCIGERMGLGLVSLACRRCQHCGRISHYQRRQAKCDEVLEN